MKCFQINVEYNFIYHLITIYNYTPSLYNDYYTFINPRRISITKHSVENCKKILKSYGNFASNFKLVSSDVSYKV